MKKLRRQLLGLGFAAGSSLLAVSAAQALTGPSAISIDGGPLGTLDLSGGVDGYAYYQEHAGAGKSDGFNVDNALVELQKTSGILQFTIEVGAYGGAITLGAGSPGSGNGKASITSFTTGPLYAGYVTIAPTDLPVTFSAGQLGSLEGYEAGLDWLDPSELATDIYYVQNSQARGVEAAYTQGPVALTVEFGDGFDDGVFNFLQALGTYTINSTNTLSVYYAGALGRTGLNAETYGSTPWSVYGPYYKNSQMLGAYYSYTQGNLNVVPEVQYVYAKADAQLGLYKSSANFGAAVFGNYTFGTSPYSLGGWVEYEDSVGPDAWFVGPASEAIGVAASPTWQYKDLFARANAGAIYLLHNTYGGSNYGLGGTIAQKFQFLGTLEAGLLF